MSQPQTVAVLGASDKPDRYSNMAVRMLQEHGHHVIPVHPALHHLEGLPVSPALAAIARPIDTLTIYVGPDRLVKMTTEILAANPGRVIFNPGAECPAVESALTSAGIPWLHACTLLLLRSGQF